MTENRYVERVDPLTGCNNLLAFLEQFTSLLGSSTESFSLLLIDLNNFTNFNEERGRDQGDSVLHWVSIVLRDTNLPVYRIGGDEFLVVFHEGTRDEREQTAKKIFARLNRESSQFSWPKPASVILIHFQNERLEIADLWIAISDSLFDAKIYGERGFLVNTYTHASAGNNYQLRVINTLTERLLSFANRLDATHQLAYLDPVTQLPNSLSAEREMQRTLQNSSFAQSNFSILFIDGDNLRFYNDISYSAGDEMLRQLSNVLANHLRPGDFLARWRVGDEFLVVLPETSMDKAMVVAERLRAAVQQESAEWQIAVTISIGIATFPQHGELIEQLLQSVEKAAKFAKDNGKNQVIAYSMEI